MHHSTVRVLRRDGSTVRGARVVLSFALGQTPAVLTDGKGEALVGHESSGDATIFVDGRGVGEMRAPGRADVTL